VVEASLSPASRAPASAVGGVAPAKDPIAPLLPASALGSIPWTPLAPPAGLAFAPLLPAAPPPLPASTPLPSLTRPALASEPAPEFVFAAFVLCVVSGAVLSEQADALAIHDKAQTKRNDWRSTLAGTRTRSIRTAAVASTLHGKNESEPFAHLATGRN
jgi:hypothetical protein